MQNACQATLRERRPLGWVKGRRPEGNPVLASPKENPSRPAFLSSAAPEAASSGLHFDYRELCETEPRATQGSALPHSSAVVWLGAQMIRQPDDVASVAAAHLFKQVFRQLVEFIFEKPAVAIGRFPIPAADHVA